MEIFRTNWQNILFGDKNLNRTSSLENRKMLRDIIKKVEEVNVEP